MAIQFSLKLQNFNNKEVLVHIQGDKIYQIKADVYVPLGDLWSVESFARALTAKKSPWTLYDCKAPDVPALNKNEGRAPTSHHPFTR